MRTHSTHQSRHLPLALAAAAVLACNPEPELLQLGQVHQAGDQVRLPGSTTQGRLMNGRNPDLLPAITEPSTISFDLATLSLPGSPTPLGRARVEQGDLAADRELWAAPPPPGVNSLKPCTGTEPDHPGRNCGWKVERVGRCSGPTQIGAGACGLGACTGQMMMRVCPGRSACDSSTALTAAWNSCGTGCPALVLSCPAPGAVYTVMSAPVTPAIPGTASFAVTAGDYPAFETLRGNALAGATVSGLTSGGVMVTEQIVSARAEDVLPPFNTTPGGTAPDYELGTTTLFTLLEQQPGGGYTLPNGRPAWFCAPNADGSAGEAIPVGYTSDDTGTLAYGGTGGPPGSVPWGQPHITFACTAGTAAKCYRWGYRPWAHAELSDSYYQACTRMARADYCGSGRSYTENGTTIDTWDTLSEAGLSPLQRHDAYKELRFEAAWDFRGALCLSHERWQHFNPDDECKLRLNEDQNTCDDEGEAWTWANDHHRPFQFLNDSQLNVDSGTP
jgi:hypothetical protein